MIGNASSRCPIHEKLRRYVSAVLNAEAAFRLIGPGFPQHRLHALEFPGADISRARLDDAGGVSADQLIHHEHRLQFPNGPGAAGCTLADIPAMVEGALPHRRVIRLSAQPTGSEGLARLVEQFMIIW